MYDLTEELEFIWDWLEKQNPDPDRYNFNSYSPGLSREQIANLSRRLPFELPEELFQLYGWKNGVDDINGHPSHSHRSLSYPFLFISHVHGGSPLDFYSLQDAIQRHRQMQQGYDGADLDPCFWSKNFFPIAGFEAAEHLSVDTSQDPAPVVQWDYHYSSPLRTYKSLSALVSTMAECCEMEIYHIVPYEPFGENAIIIEINEDKRTLENEIFKKYNS